MLHFLYLHIEILAWILVVAVILMGLRQTWLFLIIPTVKRWKRERERKVVLRVLHDIDEIEKEDNKINLMNLKKHFEDKL
jgi:peptidyl-tRNA hydrolase